MKHKKGFTIIEMLVVVALIAMVSSVIYTLLSGSKAKSRDSRREEDVKDIQNGLSIHVANNQTYPICGEEVIDGNSDCLSQGMILSGSMRGVPTDPLGHGQGSACDGSEHEYCYVSDGFSYALRYVLETDNILGKDSGPQTVVVSY